MLSKKRKLGCGQGGFDQGKINMSPGYTQKHVVLLAQLAYLV